MIRPKSVADFIAEDPGLSEPLTYEEFVKRQAQAGNTDDSAVEEAWEAYKRAMNGEITAASDENKNAKKPITYEQAIFDEFKNIG